MKHHGQASAGHVHADAPAALRGRRVLLVAVVLIAAAVVTGMVLLWAQPTINPDVAANDTDRIKGTITALQQVPCEEEGFQGSDEAEQLEEAGYTPDPDCTALSIRIDEGPEQGDTFDTVTGDDSYRNVGQGVVLFRGDDPSLPSEALYQLADIQRGVPLIALASIFVFAVLALGRLRGALAVVGLVVSLVVLIKFLVPALLAGNPPVLTAVIGAGAVMLVVLLLAHGPTVRTATAIVGTAAALVLTIVLATLFVELAGLSGLTSDEAAYVEATFGDVDLRGLLLAGIVIGALGILDDVTVTQVSTVYELRAADPLMPRRRLYTAALRVGRDHIASVINTLLLAYAGASMPLLVIFSTSGAGLGETLTNGVVAEEVVRTLVGSVGLVAAVPITTALAALMCPVEDQAAQGVEGAAGDEPRMPTAPTAPEAPSGATRFFDDEAWAARARQDRSGPTP
jgi:uncharacterized membrane protein